MEATKYMWNTSYFTTDNQNFVIFRVQRFKIVRGSWDWSSYGILKWLAWIINCNFLNNSKNPFWLKGSKLTKRWITKKKNVLNIFGKVKRDWKQKWSFWGFLIILFSKYLICKWFLGCVDYSLGYFPRLNGIVGLDSGAQFIIFYENVPYLILYQLSKFQCQTFFTSSGVQQFVVLTL